MDEGLSAWVSRAVYTPRPNTDLSTGTVSVIALPNPLKKIKLVHSVDRLVPKCIRSRSDFGHFQTIFA